MHAVELTAPEGKIYIYQAMTIKKKVVEAKTTVSLDFTDDALKDEKESFETSFVNLAKATSANFEYNKVGLSNHRRLTQGTEVTATLEYEDDTAAEAGANAVSAPDFATDLATDLESEGVEMNITEISATIREVEEEVMQLVLVDDVEYAGEFNYLLLFFMNSYPFRVL